MRLESRTDNQENVELNYLIKHDSIRMELMDIYIDRKKILKMVHSNKKWDIMHIMWVKRNISNFGVEISEKILLKKNPQK